MACQGCSTRGRTFGRETTGCVIWKSSGVAISMGAGPAALMTQMAQWSGSCVLTSSQKWWELLVHVLDHSSWASKSRAPEANWMRSARESRTEPKRFIPIFVIRIRGLDVQLRVTQFGPLKRLLPSPEQPERFRQPMGRHGIVEHDLHPA